MPGGTGSDAGFESLVRIGFCRAPGGDESSPNTRKHTRAQGEGYDLKVEADVCSPHKGMR